MPDRQFTPPPTDKTVTTDDVVGKWSFTEDYGKTTVTMTFLPSGNFTETIVFTNGLTNKYNGTWSLNGVWLQMEGFAQQFGNEWSTNSMSWYFIDSEKRLEIFGGAFPDSDAWQHLKYLGP